LKSLTVRSQSLTISGLRLNWGDAILQTPLADARPSTAFTVGYEGKAIRELVTELRGAGVKRVVDVRERAQSRKPGFSKAALSKFLNSAGIDYQHIPQLGSPSTVRAEYRRTGDFQKFRDEYECHLRLQAVFLAALVELIVSQRTALLCFESEWDSCHRGIICDFLKGRGFSFDHL
jgi:uncharacterized protein (DUF488 family)